MKATRRPGPVSVVAALVLALILAGATVDSSGQAPAATTAWENPGFDSGDDPSFPGLPTGAEVLRLENGLQVLLLPNPAQPMVGVFTQVRVGSIQENFRTSGMSHMLEHLLFNGTEKYDQDALYDLADSLGAYNNAHTSEHFTNFMVILPSRELATGLDLQSQMLFHSTIPQPKFVKERGIILGELAQSADRGDGFAADVLRDALYAGTSRALPVMGNAGTIARMDRDEVYAFYRNHYVPNNMITTIAGGFDRDAALAALKEFYGVIPPGDVERPETVPAPFIDRTRTISRRGGNDQMLTLAWEAPGYGSPDFFPFLALSLMLDSPSGGILSRGVDDMPAAERPQLTTWWDRAEGSGRLIVEMVLPADAEPATYHRMVRTALARALEWGIDENRLHAVLRSETTETLIGREQLRHMAVTVAEPLVQGGVDHFLNYLSDLAEVRIDDVARVLGAYLVDSPHLVLHVVPGAAAEKDEAATAPDTAPVVERSTLANGAVLVTLRNPGSPIFATHLASRNRSLLDGEHPGAVNLVHRLLTSGIGGCDRDCTQQKLRALGAKLKLIDDSRIPMDDYTTTGRFAYVRLETAAPAGPEALTLLLDMIQHSSFTPEDLERERENQTALLRSRDGSARARAGALLAETLYGEHPLSRAPEGDAESIAATDYDELRSLYHREFAPENLIFAVVSPLPHERIARLIENNLPRRNGSEPAMDPVDPTAEAKRAADTIGGRLAAVRTASALVIDPADAAALDLLTAILSDRLARDLREGRGLAYSVGAAFEHHGSEAVLLAWINPPGARLAEAEPALTTAVGDFDPLTISAGELDRIRSARVGRLMMRRLASIGQAYYLAMAELDGDVRAYDELFDRYAAVDLQDLRRVGAQYVAGAKFVTVVVD